MDKMQNLLDIEQHELRKFLDSFDTILTDCDGVLWYGKTPIEKSFDTLKKLQSLGKKIFFVSNNSTLSLDDYCAKFAKMGFDANKEEIILPSSVICWYLRKMKFDNKAFVIGTTAFCNVLKAAGIDVEEPGPDNLMEDYNDILQQLRLDPDVKAVIVDVDVNVNWLKLTKSIRYLEDREVLFLTGALDRRLPFGKNLFLLGIGQFVDILLEETNRQPIQCAKPSENLKNFVMDRLKIDNPSRCLFIGDSFEHDMKFADYCGFKKLWIASGVDSAVLIPVDQDKTVHGHRCSIPEYYLPSLGHFFDSLNF